jgi:hypothetical protein
MKDLEEQTLDFFDEHWEEINKKLEGTSRKEFGRDMFMNGFLLAVTQFNHMLDEYDKYPKKMREYLNSLQEKG